MILTRKFELDTPSPEHPVGRPTYTTTDDGREYPQSQSTCRIRASKRPKPRKPTLIEPLNIGLGELASAKNRKARSKTTYHRQHCKKRRNSYQKQQDSTRNSRRNSRNVTFRGAPGMIISPKCGVLHPMRLRRSGEIREMKGRSRKYPTRWNLRGGGPPPLREVELALELPDLSENQHRRKSAKNAAYEEICIPSRLTDWDVDIGQISPWIKPDQDLRNAIRLEIARGGRTKPSYIPYIVVSTHDEPGGCPPTSAHERALEAWRTSSRSYRKDVGQKCSLQAWLLYKLRFISPAELTGALAEFGGRQSQFGLLAVIRNLATAENATLAPEYQKQIRIFSGIQPELVGRTSTSQISLTRNIPSSGRCASATYRA